MQKLLRRPDMHLTSFNGELLFLATFLIEIVIAWNDKRETQLNTFASSIKNMIIFCYIL